MCAYAGQQCAASCSGQLLKLAQLCALAKLTPSARPRRCL